MVYRFRRGHGYKDIDAQTVGERIAVITATNGGQLTPSDVVDDARPDESPLHPAFTWDDQEAAEKYREDEARRLIRSYVVVRTDEAGNEREELANVSIAAPFSEEGPAYVPTMSAMENPDLRARVVALARAQLEGWTARYGHFEELASIADAIRRARESQAAAEKTIGRRRARTNRGQPQPAMMTI